MKSEMQSEIERLKSEIATRFKAQREASEKSVHFSARIVGLNSRITNLQKQLKESKARETGLQAELEKAQRRSPRFSATSYQNGSPNGKLC